MIIQTNIHTDDETQFVAAVYNDQPSDPFVTLTTRGATGVNIFFHSVDVIDRLIGIANVARELLASSDKPLVICICGSTKFKDQIMRANTQLTLSGWIVLAPGVFGHTDMPDYDWSTDGSDLKRRLDRLHFAKIDMADSVFIVNVGGYIGESTRRELDYAQAQGKLVYYLEAPRAAHDHKVCENCGDPMCGVDHYCALRMRPYDPETLGSCGCVDYHMADCPTRTGD